MLMSQATRVLVANKDPAFFFYHNPRWSIERFLGRTTWLDESRVEAARWKLMDDFFVKLSGLRANVAQDIKVCGYNYHEYPLGYGGIYREDLDCPGIMLGRGRGAAPDAISSAPSPPCRSLAVRATAPDKIQPSHPRRSASGETNSHER